MSNDTQQVDVGRRGLLRGASLIGAATLATPAIALAQSAAKPGLCTAGSLPSDLATPPKPAGLDKGDLLDNRYRITYERSVPAAITVLTQHFAALSARDLGGIADTLHFPFAVHEQFSIRMPVVVKTREQFMATPPASVGVTLKPVRFGPQDSWLRPGLYDVLVGLEVLHFDPVMCSASMVYDRYDENGKLVHRCEGVYLVTNNDGRWAIQLFSTIFTPAQDIGVEWPDALAIAFRPRMNHVLGIWDDDYDILPGMASHNSYPRVNVIGGGIVNMTDTATQDPMRPYSAKGVATRLRITETAPAQPPMPRAAPGKTRWDSVQEGFQDINKGERGGSTTKMRDARVLHHNANKIHLISGVERWNTSGEELSVTQQVQVVSYKKGFWARDLDFGYFNTHARINDLPELK
ncbi:hypothetical protein [Caulobacter sp. RHG1]|uniref:hypothetical protein n=1 Tax=Caulobacter sp. (strain RHG1) TaxID=2545762 RepID=UPI001553DA80|nr:hypothetical protein [Caulobacter sp. RHG1]NQE61659.1 hypothetical protein [Caulobacter sp. RHG1]